MSTTKQHLWNVPAAELRPGDAVCAVPDMTDLDANGRPRSSKVVRRAGAGDTPIGRIVECAGTTAGWALVPARKQTHA